MRIPTKVVAIASVTAAWLAASSVLGAQATPAKPPYPPAKVEVVIERYQADKKVSSMPFSFWVTGGTPDRQPSRGSLRIGVDVPIGSATQTRGSTEGQGVTRNDTTTVPQYRNVGTSIDCSLAMTDDAKYMLHVTLSDTSIFDPSAQRQAALVARGLAAPTVRTPDASAAFRTLSFDNSLQMRDGETAELASATDKITGEVVKAQVTLTIAK
jgi:hypothetical protein